jgi:four helix bundle protein
MQDFRNLKVWQKSHALVLKVYALTATFPKAEMFGLTAQTRRAAVSIAANIAEGSARSGDKEFAHFLQIALASASEVEYFSILIADLALLRNGEAAILGTDAAEIKRMLTGLITSLPVQAARLTTDS